eukprot:scaffold107914_cov35-Tisochrysis_lutea.AAC.1
MCCGRGLFCLCPSLLGPKPCKTTDASARCRLCGSPTLARMYRNTDPHAGSSATHVVPTHVSHPPLRSMRSLRSTRCSHPRQRADMYSCSANESPTTTTDALSTGRRREWRGRSRWSAASRLLQQRWPLVA